MLKHLGRAMLCTKSYTIYFCECSFVHLAQHRSIGASLFKMLKDTRLFLKIGSFSNLPRVKELSFTVFESIQPISGSGGSTFSLA